jgi:predicted metalloprotease
VEQFGTWRRSYWSPYGVYVYSSTHGEGWESTCGLVEGRNAAYCSSDHKIYIDTDWLDQFIYEYSRTNPDGTQAFGDGAAALVVAHEWSHHIQWLLRYPYRLRARRRISPAQFELHADCLAGMYFRYGVDDSQILNYPDGDEAATALFYDLGDSPGTPWWDANAHGSGSQRLYWFNKGYNRYSLAACDRVF